MHIYDVRMTTNKKHQFACANSTLYQNSLHVKSSRNIPSPRRQEKPTNQVCAAGSRSQERESIWIENFCTPFIPSRDANPCRGTLLVPVTNCKNLARSSCSKERNAFQNHWIYNNILNYLSEIKYCKGETTWTFYVDGSYHTLFISAFIYYQSNA